MAHLVLVHGFLGSSLNWSPVMNKLNLPLSVMGVSLQSVNLLWHARNRGPDDPGLFTLEELAKDFIQQIKAPPGEKIIALGHSFGLRALLMATRIKPDLFDAMIIEDASPSISERGFELLSRVFKEIPVPFESREAAKQKLEQIFGAESQMARFLLSNIGPDENQKQGWRFQAAALQKLLEDSTRENLWLDWEQFKKPIHLILGADSNFVTPDRLQKCLQLGSQFGRTHDSVPNAGHWVHADQSDIFCDLVQRQLETWIG